MRKLIKAASLLIVSIIAATQISYGQITFYDDINFNGGEYNVGTGQNGRMNDYNTSFWAGFVGNCSSGPCNNVISSIRIPRGYRVTLYDDFDYRGESITFTTDQPNLLNVGWNDRASSIKIEGYSQQPQIQQQQTCGGTVTFVNRSGRQVYLYGGNVSKYQYGQFNICEQYRGSIPNGGSMTITVYNGNVFHFGVYSQPSCLMNYIVAQGSYVDCNAVGQQHYIDF